MDLQQQLAENERIHNRQFKRCEAKLKEVDCPQLYIDAVSQHFNFAKKDIKEIMENGNKQR